MKNYLLLLALAASFSIVSCSNDDDDKSPAKTKSEMLSAKKWKMTDMTMGSGGQSTSLFALMDACETDNIITFAADKKYTEDEGATKCDPSDPQTASSGTWALSSDETKLIITEGGMAAEGTIKELTSSKLMVEMSQSGVTATTTFTAQ